MYIHKSIRTDKSLLGFSRYYYKMNEIEIYRIRIGLHYSRHFRIKGLEHLDLFELLIIMSLLLIAGIEPIPVQNPRPNSEVSTSSSTLSPDSNDLNIIKDKFSVVHYNVQSISNIRHETTIIFTI